MKKILASALVAALLPLSSFAASYTFTANTSPLTDISHGTAVTWGLNNSNGVNNTTPTSTTAYSDLFNDINSSNKVVISATLTLHNVRDWTGETIVNGVGDPADALFINILGGVYSTSASGLKSKVFDPNGANDQSDANWSGAVNPFVDQPLNSGTSDWNEVLQTGTPLAFQDAVTNSLLKVTTQGTGGNDTKTGTPAGVTWSDPTGGVGSDLVITFSADNLSVLRSLLDADTGTGSPNVGLGFAAECHYYMNDAVLSITTGTASVPDSGATLALTGLGLMALVGFRRFNK